jgi:hypothetical protein
LRSGDWLTAERARAYAWIFLIVAVAIGAGWVALSRGGLDPTGKQLGTDFITFYAASKLALAGHPLAPWNVAAHHAQEIALFGRDTGYAAFFYTPPQLLICLPLALIPYLPALLGWLTLTGLAYWRMARAWLSEKVGSASIFAFPAVMLNAGHGQSGFLSAALFGAGALWLETRPIAAGVCLGLLAYKPQLGLIIPVALAISGRWKTFAAAAATVIVFAAASTAVFGLGAWEAFAANMSLARATLEQALVGDAKMQSAFAAVRLWGGPLALAYAVQALVVAGLVAGLVWLQRRAPRSGAEGPAMIVAALLASPFMLDYDQTLLAAPMAWMVSQGLKGGFRDWEKTVLAAAFVLPAISRTLAMTVHIPIAPAVLGLLFVLILRRGALAAATAPVDMGAPVPTGR